VNGWHISSVIGFTDIREVFVEPTEVGRYVREELCIGSARTGALPTTILFLDLLRTRSDRTDTQVQLSVKDL
jgi:hypothetical protein